MARPLRYLSNDRALVEITTRTIQGRLLLRPSKELNESIVGVLGRALEFSPGIELHAVAHLSNHLHFLLTVPDAQLLARFMCFVNGNIAREAGRLHDWKERFWGRRYRCIEILDDAAAEQRLRYLLAHGVKERLVTRVEEWPGVNSAQALIKGGSLHGVWIDRVGEYDARRRGQQVTFDQFQTRYEVKLAPLPAWQERSAEECHTSLVEMITSIEQEASEAGGAPGTDGAVRVCREEPHRRSEGVKLRPAPACHASSRERRERFCKAYREFVQAFREAVGASKRRGSRASFPRPCFAPSLGFLPVLSAIDPAPS